MKITKHVFRNAAGAGGSSTIPPTELVVTDGPGGGVGLTIYEPSHHGPHQRAGIPLTPAEARQLGEHLVAYAVANGAG